jgi:NTE family protein
MAAHRKAGGIGMRYALALEGGGAKGAYQMGAVKALYELGFEFEAVAGTSVGALNGAMIAQGDFERAYELWENMKPSMVVDMTNVEYQKLMNLQLEREDWKTIRSRLAKLIKDGGVDTAPLRALVADYIDEEKLRQSPVDFGLVTISLTDFKGMELYKNEIPPGQITEYVLASANHPAFKNEPLMGKMFTDGGMFDNLPINLLLRRGYVNIIALRIFGLGMKQRYDSSRANMIEIAPREDLGGTFDFTQEKTKHNLQLGYYDVYRHFQKLRGDQYYLRMDRSASEILDTLFALDDKVIQSIAEEMGLDEDMPAKRLLLEKVVPMIARYLEVDTKDDYDEIAIRLLDHVAAQLEIPRFEIYNFSDFYRLVCDRYETKETSDISSFVRKIPYGGMVSKQVREELYYQIMKYVFC